MQRNVIGRITKEKSNMVPPPPQLNALCQIQRNSVVGLMCTKFRTACAKFMRIHRFWRKFFGQAGLSPRRMGPLLGVQFNLPASKGGECAENAMRA